MSWLTQLLNRIFGDTASVPERFNDFQRGFHWSNAENVSLAAGRGFNQEVVGESHYREALRSLAGGQSTTYGVNVDCAAELRQGTYEGKPTLMVFVKGQCVGSIPAADVAALLRELQSLGGVGMAVSAKARIAHGYAGADYSVRLSLSRPLKARRI